MGRTERIAGMLIATMSQRCYWCRARWIGGWVVTEESLVEDVAHRLRARGERMTRPRRAVLRALAAHGTHVCAEDVLAEVTRLDPGVHRASVYRALEALSGAGIVQHVHVGHGGTAYHLRTGDREHVHAQCRSCGAVIDLPDDALDGVAARLEADHGFAMDPGHVALSGTCTRCRAR